MLKVSAAKSSPQATISACKTEIDSSKCEIIDVYLENGNVWKAFLRKDDDIYLNTGLSVTVKI